MQPDTGAVFALVGLPFVAAALAPVVHRVLGERTWVFAAGSALASLALVASQHGANGAVGVEWVPGLGVGLRFYVDGLSLLVGYLASGVGVLVFVYSGGYMHGEPGLGRYYATMLGFMASMLGVAFAADLIALFVFWELTSVFSFLLIGHYRETAASRYAARKSMLITVGGGLFMLVGFLLLYSVSGALPGGPTFDLVAMIEGGETMRAALREAGLFVPALALVGVGAAAKSAQVPLHVWLPNAMEAPTPVSAFLHSATMVKAGVYLVGRLRPLLLTEEWMLLFAVLGLVTMAVTAMLAVTATDIKELLAYSTASHLGLIVAGFGFGSVYGAETGAFHVLNHAAFKAALFLVAGIVAHEAGTRAIDELGGLRRDLPVTAAITAIAALGMAGVPPFNGFYSKELLFEATYEAAVHGGGLAWLFPAVAVFGSVFTFLYSVRFLALFFGDRPEELGEVHAPPSTMLAPAGLLALGALGIGLGGVAATLGVHSPVEGFVGRVATAVSRESVEGFSYYIPTSLTPAAAMSAVTIVLGVAAYPAYGRLHAGLRGLLRGPVRANWWYDGAVTGLTAASGRAAAAVQNGLLRTYATWTFAAVSALTLAGYAAANVAFPAFTGVEVAPALVLVLLVAVVAGVAVEIAPSHVAGVLTLSILGFMVAIFYILASAPDLALTQLVVETLLLLIFLLVLDQLPAYYGELRTWKVVQDGALSLLVGATVTVTVLLSTAGTPEDGVAAYLAERAPLPEEMAHHGTVVINDYGGGGNIVNVILVDFRGLDTLGEISVVAMAGLSVMTLVAMRERGGEAE